MQEPARTTHLDGPFPDDLAQLGNVIILLDSSPQVPVIVRLDRCWFTPESSLGRGGVGWSRGRRRAHTCTHRHTRVHTCMSRMAVPARSGPGSHGCGWGCSTGQRPHSGSPAGHPRAQPGRPAPGFGRKDPATQGWPCRWSGVGGRLRKEGWSGQTLLMPLRETGPHCFFGRTWYRTGG